MKSQCPSTDRLSTLPQSIIENILTLMPIRDALKTSILSKKWRYCWTGMPKLEFCYDFTLHYGPLEKYKFLSAIFHVLLLHKGPLLEFRLIVGVADMEMVFDQIIPYLSRSNNVKNFILVSQDIYRLPTSFFSWQGLELLSLESCNLEPPLKFNGFSKLKRVWFIDVEISAYTLECIFSSCPLLEELTLVDYEEDLVGDNNFTCAKLVTCVPLIKFLHLSSKYIKYLSAGGMPQKLPTSLVYLKTLYLDVCFMKQDEISCALCLLRSSPNLEKINFQMYDNEKFPVQQNSINSLDPEDYSDLKLDHLLQLEIYMFSNLFLEMEFVKLIMAKSPVLKKALIKFNDNVSADEEMGILRDLILLPFPRASPSAKLTVERSEKTR
uniref:F-box/FBD/LRR-repeat protein At1g13570-like n=1 Tax=Erigeron canadensis TaxID=72917 RepID=UPI001CB918D3|nr:F-box/FBD/LRR-repeat protein At1g13570-like [Erigeron canadensis]